jgi:hypothetical protein
MWFEPTPIVETLFHYGAGIFIGSLTVFPKSAASPVGEPQIIDFSLSPLELKPNQTLIFLKCFDILNLVRSSSRIIVGLSWIIVFLL